MFSYHEGEQDIVGLNYKALAEFHIKSDQFLFKYSKFNTF